MVCTGAALSVGAWAAPTFHLTSGWWWVGLLAVFSTVIPIITMFAGVRAVGASRAAILSCAEPAVTVLSTALVYGEPLVPVQILGGLAVLAASFVLNARRAVLDPERAGHLEGVAVGEDASATPLGGEVQPRAVR